MERQLLLAILAFQNGFLDRTALLAAFDAWSQDKSRALGEVLLAQEAVDAEQLQLLEALVNHFLARDGDDAEKSLAHAGALTSSVREAFQQIADPDVQASLKNVGQEADPFATMAHAVGESTSDGTRFRILRPHARGGLGEVFVAIDGELPREVALKQIQTRHADDADSRARFVQEAEITGGLEHPNIVPVYGLGTYADGRPFYAMRFIRGDSLQEAVRRLYDSERSAGDAGHGQLELRQLLQRFIDICNAMEYAHSRGVLHRDLKPGNIMLGKYGETLLVDWGLAKTLGTKCKAGKPTDEHVLRTAAGSGSAPTQYGSAIGTPGYMSPEQAVGRLDDLGPQSDVYGLGATLYYILTGKPPFEGSDLAEVLRRVQVGDFAPPRRVNRQTPPALEAVCRKAMALKPELRYLSARDLADDIEHWLADEPTTAYRETIKERTARWARNHRAAVTGAAALAMTAFAALIIGLLVVSAEQQETERQRDAANAARGRESQQRQIAEQKQAEAEEQRLLAEARKKDADQQRDAAQWTAYVTNIQAADTYWEHDEVDGAFRRLNACNPKLRGWEFDYLNSKFHRGYVSLAEHPPHVSCVAFSPDDKRIAGGGSDTVKLWDAVTGQELLTLVGHTNLVTSVAFRRDGKQIVSGGQDKAVKLWDAVTGEELRTLDGHADGVTSVAFSPDGKQIAGGGARTVKIWDAVTGQETQSFLGHTASVTSVAFSSDGERIVSGDADGKIKIWDVATAQETRALVGHTGAVNSVAFSPDGKRVVSGGDDNTVKLWDAATGDATRTLVGHTDDVSSVAFSPDGKRVVSGSEDDTLKIWETATGQETQTLRGHTAAVTSVAFNSDGRRIVSGGDATVKLWDAVRGQETQAFRGHQAAVTSVALSPDGKRIVSGGEDATVKLWDADTGNEVLTLRGPTAPVSSVAFSPDGRWVAAGGLDNTVKRWDAATGHELPTFEHTDDVTSIAFSPDGKRIAAGDKSAVVRIWDTTTGKETQALRGHAAAVTSVAFSSDGERIVSGSLDRTTKVWDVATERAMLTLPEYCDQVSFSPDGRWIVGSSSANTLKLWDAVTGQEGLTLVGHAKPVTSVAFSPDGKRLVSGSFDATVKLWDTTTGQEMLTLRGRTKSVTCVAFSPDGRRIVSGSRDGTAILWDAAPPASRSRPDTQATTAAK